MRNAVAAFERAFADCVGATYAIAMCNGTATLHTAIASLPGLTVQVPPLTMSSTSLAVLHAARNIVWRDVDPHTWLMEDFDERHISMGVSLFGLHRETGWTVDDAAQTLRRHDPTVAFTSYSFQSSKILSTGEGGMLVTNSAELASKARSFSSLGYPMGAHDPVIGKDDLKSPTYARHYGLGWNYRMADAVAKLGMARLRGAQQERLKREIAADRYRPALTHSIADQAIPEGYRHDYWCYPILLPTAEIWHPLADTIERYGGERPYAAWRLAYDEPVFAGYPHGACPVAEDLQQRLMLLQTNDPKQASVNASALHEALVALRL